MHPVTSGSKGQKCSFCSIPHEKKKHRTRIIWYDHVVLRIEGRKNSNGTKRNGANGRKEKLFKLEKLLRTWDATRLSSFQSCELNEPNAAEFIFIFQIVSTSKRQRTQTRQGSGVWHMYRAKKKPDIFP